MAALFYFISLISGLFMTGVIWYVQLAHYPLFEAVGRDTFPEYHRWHTQATTYVVVLPMLIELISTGMWLLSTNKNQLWIWVALACVVAAWGVTFLISVPAHNQLAQGYDVELIHWLSHSNWMRTFFWTLKSAIMCWILWKAMEINLSF